MSHCRQCQSHTERVTSPLVTNYTFSSVWSESNNTCQSPEVASQCVEEGGDCVTLQEGFYIMREDFIKNFQKKSGIFTTQP